MAINVRGMPDSVVFGVVAALNQLQTDAIGSSFHQSRTEITGGDHRNPTITRVTISSANATDLATSLTLVNELKTDLNVHFADAIAHNTAVSAAVTTAAATDLATAITLANALKAAYNTHLAAANVHFTNDGTNAIAAVNATDQTSLNTLLNEFKTDLNAHMASAPNGTWINITPP
jgi:hypothetical protein